MATEKSSITNEELSNLSSEEQTGLEDQSKVIRDLRRKVGSARAMQVVGSILAILGNRPDLIPRLKPKFGLTRDEVAARQQALRKERFGLMKDADEANREILKLRADLGKGQQQAEKSLFETMQRMYTGLSNNASRESQKRGDIRARRASELLDQKDKIRAMLVPSDSRGALNVAAAADSLDVALGGKLLGNEQTVSGFTPADLAEINKQAAKLKTPGEKRFFYNQVVPGLVNAKDPLNSRLMGTFKGLPVAEANQLSLMKGMLTEDLERLQEVNAEKAALTKKATDEYEAAFRSVGGGGRFNQGQFDQIKEAILGVRQASNTQESDAVLTKLLADLESPSEYQSARQQEIERLRLMEQALDDELGPQPVREAIRRMEESPATQKMKRQLADRGYKLDDRSVVRLIMRNTRMQMEAGTDKSAADMSQLNSMISQGKNITDVDLPIKTEDVEVEATMQQPAESNRVEALKVKAKTNVDVPTSASLVQGSEPDTEQKKKKKLEDTGLGDLSQEDL